MTFFNLGRSVQLHFTIGHRKINKKVSTMKDRIIVGTPVKLSHVLIGIIVVIFLSLFLTGFGY